MQKELIFESSDKFAGCHAATLAYACDGNIVAAWFAGSHEGHDDVGIWSSIRIGSKWETPRQIAKVCSQPHWNPVLFNPGNGFIYLYFKVSKTIPSWVTWVASSADCGRTWSAPSELVAGDRSGGRGPVKNKPIILSNGFWLAPASVETKDEWKVFCDRSSDQGKNWEKSNFVGFEDSGMEGKGVIQPTLWESSPGSVHMLMRSTCGKICRSDSSDYGKTWTQARATSLQNNNSGIDLTRLDNGTLALLCNPVGNIGRRTPLTLSVSNDNGNKWLSLYNIEDDDVDVGHLIRQDGGEFSYPSVISRGNVIYAVYTRHRKQIGFIKDEIKL
ncbi:MAG TPA: neuraminidase (sialidase) [Lentisphaeria bacterium]|nr:neuraminidase (sialidase) [Lentisphaeria bacterium]